jgi:AcrR family transcriptional regulator
MVSGRTPTKEATVPDNVHQTSDLAAARPGADGDASPAERRRRARRGDGDRLRTEIVDAASRILAATGEVGELSLRAVAREVGVATTSIYLHFKNLDELILAVKVRYLDEFAVALDSSADSVGPDPVLRVRARAHAYVRYGLEHRCRYQVMFSSKMLPMQTVPDAVPLGLALFNTVRDEIAAAMGPGQDAEMLGVHVWTALHGSVMLRESRRNFPWPEMTAEVDSLISYLLRPAAPEA